jgi:hypothetical protein
MTARAIGWVLVGVIVAFGSGWLIGGSGRSAAVEERRALEEQLELTRARALILDGRVSLFLVNFGDASTRFEEARAAVERLQTSLRETGQAERAGRLAIVLSHLNDAQRLAASLDQSSQHAAAEALRALE